MPIDDEHVANLIFLIYGPNQPMKMSFSRMLDPAQIIRFEEFLDKYGFDDLLQRLTHHVNNCISSDPWAFLAHASIIDSPDLAVRTFSLLETGIHLLSEIDLIPSIDNLRLKWRLPACMALLSFSMAESQMSGPGRYENDTWYPRPEIVFAQQLNMYKSTPEVLVGVLAECDEQNGKGKRRKSV